LLVLRRVDLEFGPPLFQRAIEEVIRRIKSAGFVRQKLIDIAVLENAGRERQLLGGMVDLQRAFHELAAIIASENDLASKIEVHILKSFAVYDAFVRRIACAHFLALRRSWARRRIA